MPSTTKIDKSSEDAHVMAAGRDSPSLRAYAPAARPARPHAQETT